MEARTHQTTADFRQVAHSLLAADPIRNTILLTATAKPYPDALLLTLHDNGNIVGAVVQTSPFPLLVSAMPPDAADFTARAVHERRPGIPGAVGPLERVEAFVAAWTKLTGDSATRVMATRQFKLGELRPPAVRGTPRRAADHDLRLLTGWFTGFVAEAHPHATQIATLVDGMVEGVLKPGGVCLLWEADGTPVAAAVASGPLENMVRITTVYTPPEHRGHGYASAVTAAASQWAIDQGAENVLIFTDLANPTTNRIYPAVGYEPVADTAEYKF